MLEDARRGKFDVLVVWSLDRFSRGERGEDPTPLESYLGSSWLGSTNFAPDVATPHRTPFRSALLYRSGHVYHSGITMPP